MTPDQQISTQEKRILELEVCKARQERRITQQQMIIDRQQRFIERLQNALAETKMSEAEKVFGNGKAQEAP